MILLCGGFIDQIYGSCVNTPTEWISVAFGILSILCWMCAQFPQLVTNYKLKRAESLSPLFLGCWLGGDLTNLVGCILTHQLPTQTYTAIYYISADVVLISQAKYYHWIQSKKSKRISLAEDKKPLINKVTMIGVLLLFPGAILAMSASSAYVYNTQNVLSENSTPLGGQDSAYFVNQQSMHGSSRVLMDHMDEDLLPTTDPVITTAVITTDTTTGEETTSTSTSTSTGSTSTGTSTTTDEDEDDDETDQEEYFSFSTWEDYVGYAIGWISAVIYLASRVPQIYRNYVRKTTEGLSRLMFTFAVLGNVTYTISILVVSVNPWYILGHMPWILGSAGTLMFDATVFYQTYKYRIPIEAKPFQVETVSAASVNTEESDTYSIHQIIDVTSPTSSIGSRDYIGLKRSYYYRIGIGVPTAVN